MGAALYADRDFQRAWTQSLRGWMGGFPLFPWGETRKWYWWWLGWVSHLRSNFFNVIPRKQLLMPVDFDCSGSQKLGASVFLGF